MAAPVLPAPDKLYSTRNCELAAILYTMGFEPADSPETAAGDGVPGGRLGYWRFLPLCASRRYALAFALARGADPYQACSPADPLHPVYREQAYMAAAFHNYGMLAASLRHGRPLELRPCGFLFLLLPAEARGVFEDTADAAGLAEYEAQGSRNMQLAAAMAALGFEPCCAAAPGMLGIGHGKCLRTWHFAARSADGRWERDERLARWDDDAWCARLDNTDPMAAMADAFYNLAAIRAALRAKAPYLRVDNGRRSVLLRATASEAAWQRAERFLTRN